MAMVFTICSKRCCKNSSSLNCLSLCSSIFISYCIALLVGIGSRFSSPLTAKIRAARGTGSLSLLGSQSVSILDPFKHYNTHYSHLSKSLDGAFSSSSCRPLSPLHGLLEGHDESLLAVEQEGCRRRQLGPRVAGITHDAVALCGVL